MESGRQQSLTLRGGEGADDAIGLSESTGKGTLLCGKRTEIMLDEVIRDVEEMLRRGDSDEKIRDALELQVFTSSSRHTDWDMDRPPDSQRVHRESAVFVSVSLCLCVCVCLSLSLFLCVGLAAFLSRSILLFLPLRHPDPFPTLLSPQIARLTKLMIDQTAD